MKTPAPIPSWAPKIKGDDWKISFNDLSAVIVTFLMTGWATIAWAIAIHAVVYFPFFKGQSHRAISSLTFFKNYLAGLFLWILAGGIENIWVKIVLMILSGYCLIEVIREYIFRIGLWEKMVEIDPVEVPKQFLRYTAFIIAVAVAFSLATAVVRTDFKKEIQQQIHKNQTGEIV